MAGILTRCPVCEGTLGVSELHCSRCKTSIHGTFDTCRFCRLAPEHLAFVEMFLRSEGNLSRVEKELNLSYPTVRNRLQTALAALGLSGEESNNTSRQDEALFEDPIGAAASASTRAEERAETAEKRRTILDALARGEISADDAAATLREI